MAQPLPIFLGNGCATASEKPFHLFLQDQGDLDHGVGHPLLLLCGAKVSDYRKNKEFNELGHYSGKYSVNPSQEASSGTSCHHCTGSDRAKCFGRLMPALP